MAVEAACAACGVTARRYKQKASTRRDAQCMQQAARICMHAAHKLHGAAFHSRCDGQDSRHKAHQSAESKYLWSFGMSLGLGFMPPNLAINSASCELGEGRGITGDPGLALRAIALGRCLLELLPFSERRCGVHSRSKSECFW